MAPWWTREPWRLVQTNLRETDFLDLDARQFAEDVEKLGATVVMISTSGIVANYGTSLPYHYRNPYASNTILPEVIDACHRRGIRVIGRMDFSKVRGPVIAGHPEWAFVGETGGQVCYNGDTHVCCNSEYQRSLSLNILRETLEMLPIDGVFFNFGGYTSGYDYSGNLYGDCVCGNCRSRFREMFGRELPGHPADSPYYQEFQRRTMEQAHREVRELIRSVRPGICIANDTFSGEGFYRAEAGSSLQGGDWHYSASDLANRARTGYPAMRASITTVDFVDIAYRYASPGSERQKHRLAENIAYGGSPDLYIMGRLDNRENQAGIRAAHEMFHWHAAHGPALDRRLPQGELLLVRPDTHWLSEGGAVREYRGWFSMLSQAHYLFQAVDAARLSTVDLEKYRAVLLPAACLGEETGERLRAYVGNGGQLLATACGGQVPGWFGVDSVREWTSDTRGGYICCGNSDIGPRMEEEGATVVPIIGGYAHCAYGTKVSLRQAVIQPHAYGPPERCYYTSASSEPAYTVRREGRGQVVWVPWLPGASFEAGKLPTTAHWMQDVLEQALGAVPLETNVPPCVEIVLTKNQADGGYYLSFVNGSGDLGGVWSSPLAVGPFRAVLPLAQCSAVEGLDGEPAVWSLQNGALHLSGTLDQVLTVFRIRGITDTESKEKGRKSI